MSIPSLIETWDSIFYSLCNVVTDILCLFQIPKYSKLFSKNKELKDSHKGERCFVVMNGPSLNEHDLTPLQDEIVLCSNYFYRSEETVKKTEPNFYIWADSKLFLNQEKTQTVLSEIREACPNAKMIFNYHAYGLIGNQDDMYYSYCKHLPNSFKIRSNYTFSVSNFMTVAFHAINAAIYMGFSEIYVMGLDFEPGGFKHFADLKSNPWKPSEKQSKEEVAGLHWGYAKAQYESYELADHARKKGVKIINLNPQSNIRAFEFGSYEELFAGTTK